MTRSKTRSAAGHEIALPIGIIERRIHLIRGQKVILDSDLAELYGVPTKRLNEQVTRNRNRFPEDFMFQLDGREAEVLRSQIATSNDRRGGRRYLPRAFTEQGVAMLSSILRSERAVLVNIAIVRAFVHLRKLLATHEDLARKLEAMERTYDARFKAVFDVIRTLMGPSPEEPKRPIGFNPLKD